MSASTYPLNSAQPIQIYPSGQQGTLTLFNSGTTTTAYVSDQPSNINGFPLAPGDSISWDQGKALFAWVASGSTTLIVLDNGGTITSAGAIAQQIIAQGLADDIANSMVASSLANNIGSATGAAVPVPPSAASIGAAVPQASSIATSIYNTGVLSADNPALLLNTSLSGTGNFTPTQQVLSVAQYHTIDFRLDETGASPPTRSLQFDFSTGGVIVSSYSTTYEPRGAFGSVWLSVPAAGDTLTISLGSSGNTGLGTQTINLKAVGSYRYIPKPYYYLDGAGSPRITQPSDTIVFWQQATFAASQSFNEFVPSKAGRAIFKINVGGPTPTNGLDCQLISPEQGGGLFAGVTAYKVASGAWSYSEELLIPKGPVHIFVRNKDAATWSQTVTVTLVFDN